MTMSASCSSSTSPDLPEIYPSDESGDTLSTDVLPPYNVRAKKTTESEWKDYKAYTINCLEGFTPKGEAGEPDTDSYGGWKVSGVAGSVTGFFHTQLIDGRWWLITPEGNLFLSKGVAVFTPGNSDRQKAKLQEKFGSYSTWAAQETSTLKKHGFNSYGAWSNVASIRGLSEKFPYTVIVSPMGTLNSLMKKNGEESDGFNNSGWEGYPYDFACVFHEDFPHIVDSVISTVAKYSDDKYLIGYFIDNEIPWKNYALENCLTKWPVGHVNHDKAQAWLDSRKGKTGTTISDATDQDKRAFIAYCFDYYMNLVTSALKKYDPNHMFLGCRFNQWSYELSNDEIFKVAGEYMDVISINHYQKWEPDETVMENWYAWSGKPFMVTEYYVKGQDSNMGNTSGAGWIVRNQAERGYFFQNFTRLLIKSKTCVGWHWFKYMDNDPEDTTADSSNKDSNKGIVTWDFNYYDDLINSMDEFNHNVYQLTTYYK